MVFFVWREIAGEVRGADVGERELREVGEGEAGVVEEEVDPEDPGAGAEQGGNDEAVEWEWRDEEEEEQRLSGGGLGGLVVAERYSDLLDSCALGTSYAYNDFLCS